MRRSEAISVIVRCIGEHDYIVANLGFPSRELYAVRDRPENFYMLGSMGLASSIGLGLALFTKQQVYAIDGDGSLLMNMGSLSTIAHHAPANYHLIVLDNGAYGSTGSQLTYTAKKTDLAGMAAAAGNRHVVKVKSATTLHKALKSCSTKASIIIVTVVPGNEDVPVIPLSPSDIRARFMKAAMHELIKSASTRGCCRRIGRVLNN